MPLAHAVLVKNIKIVMANKSSFQVSLKDARAYNKG